MVTAGLLLGGRYRLVSRIGRGGMAEVWSAQDRVLEREVAVKLPLADDEPGFTDRLRREARTAARLAHPHIASVHDYGEAEVAGGPARVPYVVMELLRGESLASRLRRGPLPWGAAATLFAQVADGLAEAHAVGVVHRDLNPSNVFLTAAGGRILDFGIAFTNTDETTAPLMGTPGYVAPELLSGARPSPAADMYGFGASLRATLAGRDGTDMPADVPASVRDLCAGCLAVSPADRPGAAAAAAVLRGALNGGSAPPGTAPPGTAPPGGGDAAFAGGAGGDGGTRLLGGSAAERRRRLLVAGGGVVVLAILAVFGVALVRAETGGGNRAQGPAPTHSAPPAPTCRVAYSVEDQWSTGFKASVRVTNIGGSVINGWRMTWTFPDGQRIYGLWNGVKRQDGDTVTVTNADNNVAIKPHQTIDFGFTASREDANGKPPAFTLNGHPCRT